MNFLKFNPRICFFLGFAACAGLLAVGAYLQFVEELEPCPLCISQRLAILATGVIFLIAGLHNRGRKIYALCSAAAALIGASVSARHVWLQHLPPEEVPECSPGLEYVFQHFPLADTIKLMLTGTGECAKVDWTLLGLSIPAWTLFAFLLLAGWAGLQFFNNADAV
ncbi:disulfide bond formation protein B [Methylomonas sp. OY6]|uniref:Disulfide bond formation protein B n=1 Tax=Methylomonas defluvii TaxID=3045149 RepID=A0ABU4UGM9_9GAMM|nr:disulfide bond formation protein B [Methylomonas sp. OY6]MDX8128632.1 disulfide bond formation protein B [Methylomonas sp. OY6]